MRAFDIDFLALVDIPEKPVFGCTKREGKFSEAIVLELASLRGRLVWIDQVSVGREAVTSHQEH